VTERAWLRIGLAFLALSELPTGIWAVVDPKGWYTNFPGFGRHWVSVSGPYNQHLVTDAGAGFLAVGVLLVIALVLVDQRVLVQAALVTFLVQDVPHFVFHLVHNEGLAGGDKAFGVGGLGSGAVVAALLLVVASRRRVHRPVSGAPAR
jgi:hypothetical protein